MSRYLIAILCVIHVFTMPVRAQQVPHFIERLTIREGLSSNKINDMVQDDNGFLWIATSDGLNRFDGTEVMSYYYRDSFSSLPHNFVYCLEKLPGDVLAIGTQSGLSFYNSNSGTFRNFYYTQRNGLDEYNNIITMMECDTKGNLWAASKNSMYVFDKQRKLKQVFLSPFTEADASRKRLKYAEKMMPLQNGQMLVCLYDGWYTASAETNHLTRIAQSPVQSQLSFIERISESFARQKLDLVFPAANIFKISGGYFICISPSSDSLLLMNEKGQQLSACYFPYKKYPYVSWSQRVVQIDSSNIVFLFHNHGMVIIPVQWKENKPLLQPLSPLLFDNAEYATALHDKQGNWWLATTEDGLQKISPYKQLFANNGLINTVTGTPATYEVTSTTRDGNSLWVSTYGNGFFKIDLQTGKQQQYLLHNTSDDTWSNFIWNLRQVHADTLWLGSQIGMYWYCISKQTNGHIANYPGKPAILDSVAITTQFTDSKGLTWMGMGRGMGVCCFDNRERRFVYYRGGTETGYPLRYPLSIGEDNKNNLWFTNDNSSVLLYWNRRDNQFRKVFLPTVIKKQIGNLNALYCEGDSVLWLGSVTSGLIKFNIKQQTASIYGHDGGLINSHISNIYRDKANRLWLVTEGGLSCFDPTTSSFSNYSETEGLPVKYPTATFFYDSLDNRLYNGGHGTLFYFDPLRMKTSHEPQKTIITAMQVNGNPYMLNTTAVAMFKPQQNDITIHYAAIDMCKGPETKYAYKLVGEDTNWIMAGHQRQINFSHLSPGHYTFMVRSGNSRGAWSNDIASIQFYIKPPFVQTPWFYGIVVIAIGLVFYGMYRFRFRELERSEQMREEISKNLHDEVGSTLTNISLGSLLAQKQVSPDAPVSKLLERIYQDSQTVSQTMREIVWSINPRIDTLGEALPRMLQYASELLEAKDIELRAEISPEIDQVKLNMQKRRDLYLIFKEAVNNLAKHSGATEAGVRVLIQGNRLVLVVSDNGTGFDRNIAFMSNGVRNMEERAASHHWQLVIQSYPGTGTMLILKAEIA